MTKTTNYQLNQWAASDRVLREDFNADNLKIEQALSQIADLHSYVSGTYTGGSTDGGADAVTIAVGFKPSLVVIFALRDTSSGQTGDMMGMIGIDGCYLRANRSGSYATTGLTFTDTGFTLSSGTSDSRGFNNSALTYHYAAFH